MVFTLEAVAARYGDALLLHYGDPPELIVIDGGPPGVYRRFLEPRLQELRRARAGDGPLPIRMVMVSHIDEDHITGILDMTGCILRAQPSRAPYEILTLWHNSFDDIVGNANAAALLTASLAPGVTPASTSGVIAGALEGRLRRHSALVLASVNQGRKLRDAARKLNLLVNEGFSGLVVAPEAGQKVFPLEGGARFTVLGPSEGRVAKLQVEWDRKIKPLDPGDGDASAEAAAFVDDSVFNLASIVVLAECAGRTMLLTGDARGDDILESLERAGIPRQRGRWHFDLFKLPHHGSQHNVSEAFFREVTADHYVASSNGEKFSNPDLPTLEWLSNAREAEPYTLHLTYPEGEFDPAFDMAGFRRLIERDRARGRERRLVFREPGRPSLRIDLADPLAA